MAQKRPPEGVEFPPGPKNDFSTTDAAKDIWAACFAAVDKAQAEKVKNERNWRFGYEKHIVTHVQLSLKSPQNALAMAQAGLARFYETFQFHRNGQVRSFREEMDNNTDQPFFTGVVKGNKSADFELEVPYKGKNLRGEELVKQVQKWADYGTIEKSTADAIINVARNKELADLRGQYFVLLGAGAAMGPFLVLMALGANVIACDLDRAPIWERLITTARNSPGTLTFPLRKKQLEINDDAELFKNAGCNLLSETPEIGNWLKTLYPKEQLTIGSYVYLDGAFFVKVSLACDAIIESLCKSRKDTAVAFLCTPTDCHMVPKEAHVAAHKEYTSMALSNLMLLPIKLFSKKMLVNNAPKPVSANDGKLLNYVNGLVVPQGPNYALAKRMQHWRAIVARDQGHTVSTNIAPSTATISVIKNRQFKWAYDGMPFFKPMEIFQQETSNAVMAALLINDVRNPNSVANPAQPLVNPLELFAHNSFHGGVWRTGYTVGSIGEVSVLIHFLKVFKPFIYLSVVVLVLAIIYSRL